MAATFQSTRPLRGATRRTEMYGAAPSFQSTRPLRGATYPYPHGEPSTGFQSTRPLRGATFGPHRVAPRRVISIHAPLAGRDAGCVYLGWRGHAFQSTRPLRGATRCYSRNRSRSRNFNPRAPCGARRQTIVDLAELLTISIHAPLAGRDLKIFVQPCFDCNFNPRAPCGARLNAGIEILMSLVFQSTRPLRGATKNPDRQAER